MKVKGYTSFQPFHTICSIIVYFGLVFATPLASRLERVSVLMLSEETTPARLTKFAGYLHWGLRFSGIDISLILKNNMATADISTFFYWLFLIGRRLYLFIGDMYKRYTCPLQLYRHFTLKLSIQVHPQSVEVTHIAVFKSAYISLIIDPRGLRCETNL